MESLNYRSRSERVRFVKELKYKYINEFPDGTPFVVACENGRLADVESFVNNHDMKETGMTLKAMVNRVGKSCHGLNCFGTIYHPTGLVCYIINHKYLFFHLDFVRKQHYTPFSGIYTYTYKYKNNTPNKYKL